MDENIALIVAAGTGSRFQNNDCPKQYQPLNGKTLINHCIKIFADHAEINKIFVVVNEKHLNLYNSTTHKNSKLFSPIIGGETRQESVYAGLQEIKKLNPKNILIHDAARPMLSKKIIDETLSKLKTYKAVLPAVPVINTLKLANNKSEVIKTIDRENMWQAQTPQGFDFETIYNAHQKHKNANFTDDIALIEKESIAVKIIDGDVKNFKITTKDDLIFASAIIDSMKEQNKIIVPDIRTGFGYDVHRLEKGSHITLCGIKINCNYSLKGHSDADVALHALTDAILGTIGAGDIGEHFPPSDNKWKNMDSSIFLKHAIKLLEEQNGILNHVDITIVCEAPKISPHKENMLKNLAKITNLSDNKISIKATTTEKLGFTGRKEGIAVNAVATAIILEDQQC